MAPDISVIIPTRNRSALVWRLLTQLLAIDDDLTYEIIVVDEASSDATPSVLANFVASDGITVVTHVDPLGLPAARNVGFAHSTGRYITWIDDDDLTSRDRLRRQREALVATGRRWSCAGRVDINDQLDVIGAFPCPSADDFAREILRMNILPSAGQGLLVERSLVEQMGGYDEALRSAEDWEYAIRLGQVAEPHMLNEPLVAYRTGVASMSTNTAVMESALHAVVAKHAALYAQHDVEPDWASIHLSLLAADLLNSRWAASRRAFQAARAAPSLRAVQRWAIATVAPRWLSARSAGRRVGQTPGAWSDQAAWLRDVVSFPHSA